MTFNPLVKRNSFVSYGRIFWNVTQKIRLQCQVTVETNKSEYKNKINYNINITWFNPRISKTVSTKIGHYFLNLLDKHFPKNHRKKYF